MCSKLHEMNSFGLRSTRVEVSRPKHAVFDAFRTASVLAGEVGRAFHGTSPTCDDLSDHIASPSTNRTGPRAPVFSRTEWEPTSAVPCHARQHVNIPQSPCAAARARWICLTRCARIGVRAWHAQIDKRTNAPGRRRRRRRWRLVGIACCCCLPSIPRVLRLVLHS